MDIEAKISAVDDTCYYNIDDFTRIAKENNQKKLREAEAASGILDEYELQFEQWMVFQKSLSVMGKVRDNFVKVAEHKGVEKERITHRKIWKHFSSAWIIKKDDRQVLSRRKKFVPKLLKTDQNTGFRRRKQWVNYMQLGSVQVDMNI